jgi:hypothetical protein
MLKVRSIQVARGMARKDSVFGGGASQPVLKVVRTTADARPAPLEAVAPPVPHAEAMFSDKRSGRDRREEAPQVDDPRRQNAERRSNKQKSAWWLERDYVESHHFVQKAASAAGLHGDDPSTNG